MSGTVEPLAPAELIAEAAVLEARAHDLRHEANALYRRADELRERARDQPGTVTPLVSADEPGSASD